MAVRTLKRPDSDIAAALAGSNSVRDAADELGATPGALEKRAREPGLVALYDACAERGKARRGKPSTAATAAIAMPRWAIVMTLHGQAPVRIWSVAAANETEALDVACCVVGRVAMREELKAVQEVTT